MKLRSFFLFSILFCSTGLLSKTLIWDLGDVLFKPNKFGIARSIGISHLIGYWFFDWRNPRTNLQPLVFDVLDKMSCDPVPEGIYATTNEGIPLPAIMCHWQTGTISGKEIITKIPDHVDTLYREGYFVSRRELHLVEKTIYSMFDPYTLATNMYPIRSGIRLLRACAHERNEDGSPRNRLIALSNWDPDSFAIVCELYPDIFDLFDEIIISGETGFLKPRKASYEYLINTYDLEPHDCLVIDDQEVNLEAAEAMGLDTFLVTHNYRDLRAILKEIGALS